MCAHLLFFLHFKKLNFKQTHNVIIVIVIMFKHEIIIICKTIIISYFFEWIYGI